MDKGMRSKLYTHLGVRNLVGERLIAENTTEPCELCGSTTTGDRYRLHEPTIRRPAPRFDLCSDCTMSIVGWAHK
jgi:hypothetical protein